MATSSDQAFAQIKSKGKKSVKSEKNNKSKKGNRNPRNSIRQKIADLQRQIDELEGGLEGPQGPEGPAGP